MYRLQLVFAYPLVVLSLRRPLILSSCQLVVALPLVAPPNRAHRPLVVSSCQLVLAYPLVVLLLRHPLILSSRRLVVASPLVAPPTRDFVVPPSHPLFVPADCCITFHCPLDVPPTHHLIAPAGCCIASPCSALLSSCCAALLLVKNIN